MSKKFEKQKLQQKALKKDPPPTITQSSKILRKVPKQKVNEIDKRNILKAIGVEKPKKLQKYLK